MTITCGVSGSPVQQSLQLLQVLAARCLEQAGRMGVCHMPPPRPQAEQRDSAQLECRLLEDRNRLLTERDHLPIRHLRSVLCGELGQLVLARAHHACMCMPTQHRGAEARQLSSSHFSMS